MADTNQSAPFTLAATGDAILTRSVLAEATRSSRFEDVLAPLRDADATVSNLEVVLTDDDTYATPARVVADQYQYLGLFPAMGFQSDPALADELTAMGIDLFAAASNHSYDFGRPGMESTMEALESRGIPYAGLGRSLAHARAPAYLSTPGGRVGLVSATTSVAPGSEAGAPTEFLPGRPGISPLHVNWTYRLPDEYLDRLREIAEVAGIEDVKGTWLNREGPTAGEDAYKFMHMRFERAEDEADAGIEHSLHEPDREAILGQVREAADTADWTVASLHSHQGPGGTRNVPETPTHLAEFARECIEAGADAFVGTGPHVLRGVEIYGGKPIFYSLGNFFCQYETLNRLPAQSFDYFEVEDATRPTAVFDSRYYDDGEPTGNLAYPEYWWTVVPTCRFGGDGDVARIDLLPCTLGRKRERSRRGTPLAAEEPLAAEILDRLAELSEPFGTDVERDGARGTITPG